VRLDNRRSNLRIVTHGENMQNMPPRRRCSSAHRGVSWNREMGRWAAYAKVNGRQVWLGYYEDELRAAAVASDFRAKHMPFSEDRNQQLTEERERNGDTK